MKEPGKVAIICAVLAGLAGLYVLTVWCRVSGYDSDACWSEKRRDLEHYIGTRKDLIDNGVRQAIDSEARRLKLLGAEAEENFVRGVAQAMHTGIGLPHFRIPRVQLLPTVEQCRWPALLKPGPVAGLESNSI